MPEVTRKEQAVRSTSTHNQEVMKIAQEIVGMHNPFPQSNWSDSQALLQELQTIDSAITNIPMSPQEELKSRHIEPSNNMQQQFLLQISQV
jgi:hypothetical protein